MIESGVWIETPDEIAVTMGDESNGVVPVYNLEYQNFHTVEVTDDVRPL